MGVPATAWSAGTVADGARAPSRTPAGRAPLLPPGSSPETQGLGTGPSRGAIACENYSKIS